MVAFNDDLSMPPDAGGCGVVWCGWCGVLCVVRYGWCVCGVVWCGVGVVCVV